MLPADAEPTAEINHAAKQEAAETFIRLVVGRVPGGLSLLHDKRLLQAHCSLRGGGDSDFSYLRPAERVWTASIGRRDTQG